MNREQSMIETLRDGNRELRARITELEAALRKVAVAAEWAATLGGGFSYCPVCGNEKRDGHAPGCEIRKALEGGDG